MNNNKNCIFANKDFFFFICIFIVYIINKLFKLIFYFRLCFAQFYIEKLDSKENTCVKNQLEEFKYISCLALFENALSEQNCEVAEKYLIKCKELVRYWILLYKYILNVFILYPYSYVFNTFFFSLKFIIMEFLSI